MSRILHLADLHLDTAFQQIASPGTAPNLFPRQHLRDCLHRIVDLALQHKVDVVTIGGDLYEHERRSADTGNFIRAELGRLGSIPAVIAPGNHDPFSPASLYCSRDWPSNVRIFGRADLEGVDVSSDLSIWGAAFTNHYRRDSPLDNRVAVSRHGRFNVLLLHAAVGEAPSDYSPLPAAAPRQAGFDLALLGHIHDRNYSRPEYGLYYPGSPEPLDFSETGARYVLLVDTDAEPPQVSYLPVNSLCFGSVAVDVEGADSRDAVGAAVLRQAEAAGLTGAVVRARLRGVPDPDVDLDPAALRAALAPHFAYIELWDETEPPYDLESEAQGYTTKARFVRRLLNAIEAEGSEEERQVLQEALLLGLRAFEGKPLAARQRPPAVSSRLDQEDR